MTILKLSLTAISGLCWTLVYIDGIRLGIRDRSYAIPFYALALNVSWELLHTILGFRLSFGLQTIINTLWFLFDIGILYTYFKYGRKYFVRNFPYTWFVGWSALGLVVAFVVEYAFVREFGVAKGGAYAAFLQNLLMSVLFINMLIKRGTMEGQSVAIGINKWLGTLAPTVLYGVIGGTGFHGPSFLILVVGLFCSIFDLLYLWLLFNWRKLEIAP
ncbi:MAG: hypothetical protein ABR555_02380 [Pyrinomonadaceae bacterium]